jgi:hypothetical protein
MRDTGIQHGKCLTQNSKPLLFGTWEIMVGLKDYNPTTSKEDAKLEGKVDESYAEFKGKETLPKRGNFDKSKMNGIEDARLQVRANDSPLEF